MSTVVITKEAAAALPSLYASLQKLGLISALLHLSEISTDTSEDRSAVEFIFQAENQQPLRVKVLLENSGNGWIPVSGLIAESASVKLVFTIRGDKFEFRILGNLSHWTK